MDIAIGNNLGPLAHHTNNNQITILGIDALPRAQLTLDNLGGSSTVLSRIGIGAVDLVGGVFLGCFLGGCGRCCCIRCLSRRLSFYVAVTLGGGGIRCGWGRPRMVGAG